MTELGLHSLQDHLEVLFVASDDEIIHWKRGASAANFTHSRARSQRSSEYPVVVRLSRTDADSVTDPTPPFTITDKVPRWPRLVRVIRLHDRFGRFTASRTQFRHLAPRRDAIELHFVLHAAVVDVEVVGLRCICCLMQA